MTTIPWPDGREMRPGEVLLLRPGVWHGYQDCQRFEVYNCCFSSELLRRELSWTREDPLLGFLLWAGPYSSPGRGVLTISVHPPALGECLVHLDALAALRHRPPALHRPDIVGRLSLPFGQLGQAVAQLRAEHAAVLLLYSDEPVTSIGRTVGWPDQSKFARRFKAHYGLSATAYWIVPQRAAW